MKGYVKSPFYRKFRLFKWEIYISKVPLKRRDPERNRGRDAAKRWRLEYVGHRCELCGIPINMRCSLYRIFPMGTPGRNSGRNVRVICPKCHDHVHRVGGYRPMIGQKGGAL